MTERGQSSEVSQRRQICDRINELKSSCVYLSKVRDNLSTRLSELNKTVDNLLMEKFAQNYDPNLNTDSAPNHITNQSSKASKHQHEQFPRPMGTTDLTSGYDFSSRRKENTSQGSPSEAFKTKLSLCLQEIAPKAEEILELGQHLYNSKLEK